MPTGPRKPKKKYRKNLYMKEREKERGKSACFYRCPDVEVADNVGKRGSKWKGWGPIIWFVKSRDVSASRIRVSDSRPVECGPVSNQTHSPHTVVVVVVVVAVSDATVLYIGALSFSSSRSIGPFYFSSISSRVLRYNSSPAKRDIIITGERGWIRFPLCDDKRFPLSAKWEGEILRKLDKLLMKHENFNVKISLLIIILITKKENVTYDKKKNKCCSKEWIYFYNRYSFIWKFDFHRSPTFKERNFFMSFLFKRIHFVKSSSFS